MVAAMLILFYAIVEKLVIVEFIRDQELHSGMGSRSWNGIDIPRRLFNFGNYSREFQVVELVETYDSALQNC